MAEALGDVIRKGLKESADELPGGSLKSACTAVAAGKYDSSPCPADVVDRVKVNLRVALKRAGQGDGYRRMATSSR